MFAYCLNNPVMLIDPSGYMAGMMCHGGIGWTAFNELVWRTGGSGNTTGWNPPPVTQEQRTQWQAQDFVLYLQQHSPESIQYIRPGLGACAFSLEVSRLLDLQWRIDHWDDWQVTARSIDGFFVYTAIGFGAYRGLEHVVRDSSVGSAMRTARSIPVVQKLLIAYSITGAIWGYARYHGFL